MTTSLPTSPHDAPAGRARLTVYENRFCGYCMDVRQVIGELGIDVKIRSVAENPAFRSELIRATGRSTVPVLKIEEPDGSVRWLPESRDIIAYLYTHAGVSEPGFRVRPYTLLRLALVAALLLWGIASRNHWL